MRKSTRVTAALDVAGRPQSATLTFTFEELYAISNSLELMLLAMEEGAEPGEPLSPEEAARYEALDAKVIAELERMAG